MLQIGCSSSSFALELESRPSRQERFRASRHVCLALEHLDHRQLLSVTFTGNVTTDFSATNRDVVIVRPNANDPRFSVPVIEEPIRDLVKVSGFHLSAIRLVYDAQADTLQVGIEQPDNQKSSQAVIVGDIDNNLNGDTVDPEVSKRIDDPDNYIDFPSLGGTETMLTYFKLDPQNTTQRGPNIVAGVDAIRNDPAGLKSYQVAKFNVNANPDIPGLGPISPFGEFLPDHTGPSLIGVSPTSPSFEFTINKFSQLYASETGKTLQFPLNIELGAFAGSSNDGGTSEAFIPGTLVTIPAPQQPSGGSQSPQVLINPHSQQHINTFVNAKIRVYVFGTSGFDVSKIDPQSVRLGGATPTFNKIRSVNSDQFPDRLFVFDSKDVKLPRGAQDAVVSGKLTDGSTFESAARVYNQPGFFTEPSNDNTPVPIKPLKTKAQETTTTAGRQLRIDAPATSTLTGTKQQTRRTPQKVKTPNPSMNRPLTQLIQKLRSSDTAVGISPTVIAGPVSIDLTAPRTLSAASSSEELDSELTPLGANGG